MNIPKGMFIDGSNWESLAQLEMCVAKYHG